MIEEDFLTIKGLSDTLQGEKAQPEDVFDLEQKKMNKIVYIRQCIGTSSCHEVENEINVYEF